MDYDYDDLEKAQERFLKKVIYLREVYSAKMLEIEKKRIGKSQSKSALNNHKRPQSSGQ